MENEDEQMKTKKRHFSILDLGRRENPSNHWKERLKTSKIVKFLSDLLKTDEDIAFKVTQFYRRL